MKKNKLDNAYQHYSPSGRSEENYTYVPTTIGNWGKNDWLNKLWKNENRIQIDGHWYVRLSDVCAYYSCSGNILKNRKDK